MLNSSCLISQPLAFDVTAHLVILIALPTYGTAIWVLCSKFPLHFQRYRLLLMIHVVTCLLMEIHMSIFWQLIIVVPWVAICSKGLAAEYSVLCFQICVALLISIGISILKLFKHRMNATLGQNMERLQKVARAFECLTYMFTTIVFVFMILSFNFLRYQSDYKKQLNLKFVGSIPEFIWCDNCFFLRLDSTIILLYFASAYCTTTTMLSSCCIAIYVSYKSLTTTGCKLSSKTIVLQRNFLNSLFLMTAVHLLCLLFPIILFFIAHLIVLPNSLMRKQESLSISYFENGLAALIHLMVLMMQEHGTISTIVMMLTNSLLLQIANNKFRRIVPRKLSRVGPAIFAMEVTRS